MQIGSGQSPLTLAVMKALGVQAPAAPATAAPTAAAAKVVAKPASEPSNVHAGVRAGVESSSDLGVSKSIPRGSFVDFKA